MQVRLIPLLNNLAITIAYFFTGLSSSFLFWLGLLFEDPFYPTKITLVSSSLTLVLVAWIAHRKFRGKSSMRYSTPAFIGGGTIGTIGVWFLFLLLVFWASIVAYGHS